MAALLIAVTPFGCGPDNYREHTRGSLFLMNQTHAEQRLSLFRTQDLDCVVTARDAVAALVGAELHVERCVTLAPAELVALDSDPWAEEVPLCDAVGIEGPGLTPHALFWIDTESVSSADSDAVVAIVDVGRTLVLEPPASVTTVPLATLPESPCR